MTTRYYRLENAGWKFRDPSGESWISLPFWLRHEFPLEKGVRIENWDSRILAFVDDRGSMKDFPHAALGDQFMSARLQEVISAAAPDAIQFLPIRMLSPIGEEVAQGFALANYLIWCDAVDRKKSVPWAGTKKVVKDKGAYHLDKLVLNPTKIDAPIFRVVGLDNVEVYREDVVERINGIGATGVLFEPIES